MSDAIKLDGEQRLIRLVGHHEVEMGLKGVPIVIVIDSAPADFKPKLKTPLYSPVKVPSPTNYRINSPAHTVKDALSFTQQVLAPDFTNDMVNLESQYPRLLGQLHKA